MHRNYVQESEIIQHFGRFQSIRTNKPSSWSDNTTQSLKTIEYELWVLFIRPVRVGYSIGTLRPPNLSAIETTFQRNVRRRRPGKQHHPVQFHHMHMIQVSSLSLPTKQLSASELSIALQCEQKCPIRYYWEWASIDPPYFSWNQPRLRCRLLTDAGTSCRRVWAAGIARSC